MRWLLLAFALGQLVLGLLLWLTPGFFYDSIGRHGMRVFVAGATGAIGRPLVASLLAARHEVTGSTRSAERAEGIRGMGAEAAYASALGAKPPRRVPLWLAR